MFEEDAQHPLLGKPNIGPILLVCFTNHALDSMLVDILDATGMREGLVRVGGRSNCERLEEFNLRLLRSSARGHLVAGLNRQLEDLEKEAVALGGSSMSALKETVRGHLVADLSRKLEELEKEAVKLGVSLMLALKET
eukprot:gene6217-2833_t